MPEKIIIAHDAVYVSEGNPLTNHFNEGRIKVGLSNRHVTDCFTEMHPDDRFDNIGLVQFAPFSLPEDSRILSARLHMFFYRARFKTNCIQLYPNTVPFDGRTVNWETKPPIGPAPVSTMILKAENQCGYVTCDVTPLVKCSHNGQVSGFGISLIADRASPEAVMFCSDKAVHPVYASIEYDKCGGHPGPGPGPAREIENIFNEHIFDVEAAGSRACTQNVRIENAHTVTFFVKNTGSGDFNFNLQVSPDGIDFLDDKQTFMLQPGEIQAITPYLFAKYMRACINPVSPGGQANAHIWCQMQTRDYLLKS